MDSFYSTEESLNMQFSHINIIPLQNWEVTLVSIRQEIVDRIQMQTQQVDVTSPDSYQQVLRLLKPLVNNIIKCINLTYYHKCYDLTQKYQKQQPLNQVDELAIKNFQKLTKKMSYVYMRGQYCQQKLCQLIIRYKDLQKCIKLFDQFFTFLSTYVEHRYNNLESILQRIRLERYKLIQNLHDYFLNHLKKKQLTIFGSPVKISNLTAQKKQMIASMEKFETFVSVEAENNVNKNVREIQSFHKQQEYLKKIQEQDEEIFRLKQFLEREQKQKDSYCKQLVQKQQVIAQYDIKLYFLSEKLHKSQRQCQELKSRLLDKDSLRKDNRTQKLRKDNRTQKLNEKHYQPQKQKQETLPQKSTKKLKSKKQKDHKNFDQEISSLSSSLGRLKSPKHKNYKSKK